LLSAHDVLYAGFDIKVIIGLPDLRSGNQVSHKNLPFFVCAKKVNFKQLIFHIQAAQIIYSSSSIFTFKQGVFLFCGAKFFF